MHTTHHLGHEDARHAIDAICQEARRRGTPATVAVSDSFGELIGLLRIDGAPLPSIVVAGNKAWTAARERRPTAEVGQAARDPADSFQMDYFGDGRHTGWGGGLPVCVDGVVVGAVAVSGLTSAEDVELAQIGVAAIVSAMGD
jgi:glc operon protein GlcG